MSRTYFGCLSCKETVNTSEAPIHCECKKVFLDKTGDLTRVVADMSNIVISDKSYWECKHFDETWSWELTDDCMMCLAQAEGKRTEREKIMAELTEWTDRFNRGESSSNIVMYLYRFIESKKVKNGTD